MLCVMLSCVVCGSACGVGDVVCGVSLCMVVCGGVWWCVVVSTCSQACARVASIHRDVLNVHTEAF